MAEIINPYSRKKVDLRGKKVSLETKKAFVEYVKAGHGSALSLDHKFNLPMGNVARWKKQQEKKKCLLKQGRPFSVCPEDYNSILEEVKQSNFDMKDDDLKKLVQEKADSYRARIFREEDVVQKPISVRLYGKLKQKLNLKTAVGEDTTMARADAESDVRNFCTFAAANLAIVPKVDPHLILNIDATQFAAGDSTASCTKVVRAVDPEGNVHEQMKNLKCRPSKRHGISQIFIKYYLLISAAGFSGEPVLVIANQALSDDYFDVKHFRDLGITCSGSDGGFLAVMKKRGGNNNFFKWLMGTYLIDFVKKQRTLWDLDESKQAWFQLDGEPVQLAVFSDIEVRDKLTTAGIIAGKPPASTSAITQPCDAGNIFKQAKQHLKTMARVGAKTDSILLECLMTHLGEKDHGYDSRLKRLASLGIIMVKQALIRQTSWTPSRIRGYMTKNWVVSMLNRCGSSSGCRSSTMTS